MKRVGTLVVSAWAAMAAFPSADLRAQDWSSAPVELREAARAQGPK